MLSSRAGCWSPARSAPRRYSSWAMARRRPSHVRRARHRRLPPPPKPTVERVRELAARVPPGNRVTLRARPGGRILARVGGRTEFGSPQVLAVAFRKGDWLAVRSPELGNDQLGWVRAAPLRLLRRPVELEVDLSRRELLVRDEQGAERPISVAIGAPDTPTPTGEYYVTDKLPGADFGSYYGCCILALSGRQPNLPRAGRAATGSRSTAHRPLRGARRSRTAASTPRRAICAT